MRKAKTGIESFKEQWWWRRGTKDWTFDKETFATRMKTSSTDTAWKSGGELIAWWYELAIRHDRNTRMPQYPKADPDLLAMLEEFSTMRPSRVVIRFDQLPVSQDLLVRSSTSWTEVLKVQCDLAATDNELVSSFLNFMRSEVDPIVWTTKRRN